MLFMLTCVLVLCTPNAGRNLCMGWRIPSLFKSSNFLSPQLSHLTTVPYIHLAMATKPPQLIKASFTLYKNKMQKLTIIIMQHKYVYIYIYIYIHQECTSGDYYTLLWKLPRKLLYYLPKITLHPEPGLILL